MKLLKIEDGFSSALVVFALIAILAIGGVTYRVYTSKSNSSENPKTVNGNASKTQLEAMHEDIADKVATMAYLDTSHADVCYVGQNNSKVQDGFDRRCAIRLNHFYGIDDFRPTIVSLEGVLLDIGWSGYSEPTPFTNILIEYFDTAQPYSGQQPPVNSLPFGPNDFKKSGPKIDDTLGMTCSDSVTKIEWYETIVKHKQYPLRTGDSSKVTTLKNAADIYKQGQQKGYEFMCMISIERVYLDE